MKFVKTLLASSLVLLSSSVWAEQPYGDWLGTLMGSMRIKVQISKNDAGTALVKLTSIDQGNAQLIADSMELAENKMEFAFSSLGASYKATWDQAGQQWRGEWIQSGQAMKLDLSVLKGEPPAPPKKNRPQLEAIQSKKSSYTESEIQFLGLDNATSFAGTLCIPAGQGAFPGAVLVHGSGPNTRNEELFGHQIFTVISDHLCQQGIAVLRYDKRGVGASKGAFKTATTFDFADDAQAAVKFMRQQPRIDAKHVGIIGHSEGGLIAPIVASRDAQVNFMILLGGPGIAIDQLMIEQARDGEIAEGHADQAEKEVQKYRKIYDLMLIEKDVDALRTQMRAIMMADPKANEKEVQSEIKMLTSPWFLSFIRMQPQLYLAKVKQATLALNGERDFQVNAKSNLAGIRQAMKHNKNVTAIELPQLNHLFQTSTTGAFSEYDKIEETVAPLALNAMSDWLVKQFKLRKK